MLGKMFYNIYGEIYVCSYSVLAVVRQPLSLLQLLLRQDLPLMQTSGLQSSIISMHTAMVKATFPASLIPGGTSSLQASWLASSHSLLHVYGQ